MIKDVAMLNVNGAAMVGAPGSYAKVFDVLGKNNINVMMISTAVSEANISMIIKRGLLGRAISNLEIALAGTRRISQRSHSRRRRCSYRSYGRKHERHLGCCIKNFQHRRQEGHKHPHDCTRQLRTKHIFVVKEKDGVAVVRAIHEEFNLDKI